MSAKKVSRKASDIQLIAITKNFPASAIYSTMNAGLFCIGESRVQEAEKKLFNLKNREKLETHLIGHLQSNKVKKAVKIFDVIQTIDSIKLAKKISRASESINKKQRVYIQINTGEDPQKGGFKPNEAKEAAHKIMKLNNLILEGIMMIPPYNDIDKHYREIYSNTKKLKNKIIKSGIDTCKNLSMGMSRDYQIAIEEGATHIRIGTALFGKRNQCL